MNTQFTVSTNKGKDDEKAYSIDLGVDVLDGISDIDIRIMAEQSKKIKIQGPLRKLDSALAMETALHKTYPDATVVEGVVKAPTQNAIVTKLVKKFDGDTEAAMEAIDAFLEANEAE